MLGIFGNRFDQSNSYLILGQKNGRHYALIYDTTNQKVALYDDTVKDVDKLRAKFLKKGIKRDAINPDAWRDASSLLRYEYDSVIA